jgi:hypothetical protein
MKPSSSIEVAQGSENILLNKLEAIILRYFSTENRHGSNDKGA